MLLEGAIGDAYGAGFEFASEEKILDKNNLTHYESHPLYPEIKGRYTDDTQMAIAISELLVENKDWTPERIANKFVDVFKRDPRRGYAKRFFSFLSETKNGKEFLKKIIGKSERNGAAMRAYPLGILDTEEEIIFKSDLQASLTHNTTRGKISAQAIALSTHYFLYKKGTKHHLLDYLKETQNHIWEGKWNKRVDVDAFQTVEAVLLLIINEDSLKQILQKSVNFGGDVDTVASLALAIGSSCDHIVNDIPEWCFNEIENDQYGSDYLRVLDESLKNL